ncbi:MAG: hypothetical protein VKI83_05030 [Synechococcaceae cyanobacterium]|nr:hypothetical protein [Synechococcaceae cyanobacterium]
MHAPQSLIQAALQRLAARIGSGLMDGAAGLAVLAQEAPERLRQEITLFWQEVEQEAERLERGQAGAGAWSAAATPPGDAQERIDALRARVAELASRLESLPLQDRA